MSLRDFKFLVLAGGQAQFVGMKKWLLRIGLGLLAVLGLLLGVVGLESLTPVPPVSLELQLPRASLPQGSNAFAMLESATNHLWWPKVQDREISNLARDTNWDEALASTVLASNREALAGWDAAVKLPGLQVPEVSTTFDLMPYLADWRTLARLAEVRANALLHHGQDQEAFDQIVNHIRLGQRMQNSRGVLIVYLVGTAVQGMGLNQMQHWAGKTQLTAEQLKSYILQLNPQPGVAGAALANSIKVEYQGQINTLAAMRDGRMTNSESGGSQPHLWSIWPFFSFSQTRALCFNGALALVKAAPHHYSEANIVEMEWQPSRTSLFLSGNVVGQILYHMMKPALTSSLATKSKNDVQLQATRTILALRAYQLTHGNLPADLNALVPEFLEAVPLDDFDGKPLRYSAGKKIVYSVGKNLKDDGGDDRGSDAPESQRHLDLVYKFDF